MSPLRPLVAAFFLLAASQSGASTVDEQMRAVEKIRGLKFSGPVAVEVIERDQLAGHLRAQIRKTLPYPESEWERILRALQLVDDGPAEGFSSLLTLYESQVLAYYDPGTKTYYAVRQLPPAVSALLPAEVAEESVAVHELTHALQDQRFAIGRRDFALRFDNDAALAYHALLEGEATLVMLAHLTAKNGVSLDDLIGNDMMIDMLATMAGSDAALPRSTPRYFGEMLKFPYLEGLRYVIDAYRRGGWSEIDRIHANPPSSTSEILHRTPRATGKRLWTGGVALPARDILSVEHLGEFHWAFLAGAENARGWVDDRVVIAQDARCETTTLADTEWESPEAARRFHDAYTRFLDARGSGSIAVLRGTNVKIAYGNDRGLMERFVAK